MAGTVVAVFPTHIQAEDAAQALLDDGVSVADIAIVARDAGGERGPRSERADTPPARTDAAGAQPTTAGKAALTTAVREVPEHDVERPLNTADEAIARAVVGFVVGAPLASLLVALAVYFPGMDTVYVNHPLMPQLGGGIIGGIVGALVGALTAGGIPTERARRYHAHVQEGHALVTVLASSRRAPHIQQVLQERGGTEQGYFSRFLDSLQSIES